MASAAHPVHPRVCGEHPFGVAPANAGERFIPACAGNTDGRHQHGQAGGGSSPRVRGTRVHARVLRRPVRFIPACAGNTPGDLPHALRNTVHPRVCGEHLCGAAVPASRDGSSPRVRGTRAPAVGRRVGRRFIPACAGNTRSCSVNGRPPPVHPRVCGEHASTPVDHRCAGRFIPACAGTRAIVQVRAQKSRFIPACAGNTLSPVAATSGGVGSSPRVRGTRDGAARPGLQLRFIPACAGNTSTSAPAGTTPTVHPRVCGEHQPKAFAVARSGGSSPRVRGTHHHASSNTLQGRFIPACAGNTPPRSYRTVPAPVHPRVCGEHSPIIPQPVFSAGSSPRVRGTRDRGRQRAQGHRFIPACAGNTTSGGGRFRFRSVHPRVCGEHCAAVAIGFLLPGSSPRVRGTPLARTGTEHDVRFIPACAGNTGASVIERQGDSVHPRVCGEHQPFAAGAAPVQRFIPACAGNTPPPRETANQAQRFIPACAGNTRFRRGVAPGRTVHPRVCGEHPPVRAAGETVPGSSPRVRGTRNRWRSNGVAPPVHPRVCGEHRYLAKYQTKQTGSSPRVRGTLGGRARRVPQRRFIPACAGNTRRERARPLRLGGSSPRVRGTRHAVSRGSPYRRFIPACAGNTPLKLVGRVAHFGSSPRVRGTRTA